MGAGASLDVFQQTVYLIMMMASVILIPGLIVGLMIAVFQAATQINEMSMTFVPKFMITMITLLVAGDWLMGMVMNYTQQLIINIPYLIG